MATLNQNIKMYTKVVLSRYCIVGVYPRLHCYISSVYDNECL